MSLEVVHVGPNLLPVPPPLGGAIERRMWGLGRAQREAGARVTILASSSSRPTEDEALPDVVPLRARTRMGFAMEAARWIRRREPDVVHLHSRPEIGALLKARGSKALIALSFDFPLMFGRVVHALGRGNHAPVGSLIDRSVDLFLPVSDFAATALGRSGVRLPAERTRILWNGLEPSGPMASDEMREPSTALFVGRSVRQKGADLFEAAADRLASWQFVAVGPSGAFSSTEGPHNAGSTGRVRRLGPLPDADVKDWMRRATCLVSPTREWEAFGMVLIEALSQGAAVVAPHAEGPAEILASAPATRFFERGDLDSLHRAITAAQRVDRDERSEAQRFAQRFSWRAIAQTCLLYYRAFGRG